MGLVEKIIGRMKHWSTKLLSYVGRVQLLKSVTFATTNYWMTCLPLPKCVINKIDAVCRSFLRTGSGVISRKSLISWEQVCRPKSNEGMNLIDLSTWKRVTMMKLLCNICCKKDSMWMRWVHAYYLKKDQPMEVEIKDNSSWIVKKIFKYMDVVRNMQLWENMKRKETFNMKEMYRAMRGDYQKVLGEKSYTITGLDLKPFSYYGLCDMIDWRLEQDCTKWTWWIILAIAFVIEGKQLDTYFLSLLA